MSLSNGEYESEISEWWDHEGNHHGHAPDADQLLDDATQVTIHMWDDEGNDLYASVFSPDGWTEDEINEDIEDAADFYGS